MMEDNDTTLEAVDAVVQMNLDLLESMKKTVNKYLDQCGRRWVEMNDLFSFMKL